MEYVYYISNSGELCHHGVKGMKWGRRKASYYTEKSRSHASKIATSKTRLGKSYHNNMAYINEVRAGDKKTRESVGKGSILKDIDNVYGHGATARYQRARSNYYSRKAGYTKTRLGTNLAKASAYNNKTAAEANTKLHNAKNLQDYGMNFVNAVANRSIQTWSGRHTTTGKQYVDNLITGGTIGMMADVNHYTKNKK